MSVALSESQASSIASNEVAGIIATVLSKLPHGKRISA